MPSVNDFKNKKSKHKKTIPAVNLAKSSASTDAVKSQKRRPGREASATEIQIDANSRSNVVNEEKKTTQTASEAKFETKAEPKAEAKSESKTEAKAEAHAEEQKVEINFPGSELLRAKMPKPFAVAEQVATEWKNDGSFEALPLGHPVAQMLAASGLRKAKDFEKKVIESGVIEKVAFRALTVGMKAQQEIQNIRDQVKSKLGKK